ncbi:hypothetical protein YC2023_120902 [Brassica napus]
MESTKVPNPFDHHHILGFYTLDPLLNTSFHYNRLPSPATINPKFPFLFSQVSNPKFPFLFFWINVYYNLISGFIVGGDDDALSKSFRAKRMIADLLFWALDKRNCRNDEPANLLIVSNNISDQPELVNVLKALELDGFNILLVQSDEKEEKPDDIPTEGFDWLWRSILEVGGSHVGHQSGSSQFNDICSICGNDVPDFGGDTCSICEKEEEALDQEEQVLQKRNKLLDDIDLKIASLKLLFIARKFLKEKKLGVSSWIIDDPRPGQNSRNRRTEPEPNRNTRNRNRTNTLKYSNVGGDDDALSKSFRAKRMIADLLFWALDKRNCRNDEPANLLIVSNNISDQPELVNVLKALELDGFNILLVQSDEKEEKPDDIPTEGFQWLWRSILEVGGSHVGHQSGSSQFNDICSICGNDVPDFGGDTCSICAKEEEALDQEEQVLQKRNKLLDDIDLKIASLKLLFIARKFLKEKKLGVSSWIIDDPRPGQNSRNRRTEPEPNRNTRNRNRTNTLKYSNVGGDDDALSKSFRAKRMIADLLFWALDKRNCRNDEPANLLIVSNNISDQPELVNVLKALELDGFNILLVQSDEKEEKPDDIPTEGFQWLWRSILEVGGSHVGHQSGSSQFNDICSICGNDVPDFGGDTCSICAKEEEALDQEEQVLQKRNKLLDDIDLKIASLKLLFIARKFLKEKKLGVSSWIIDDPRPGQNSRNRRTEPEPNRNTRNRNRTNTLKYSNVGGDDDALSKSFRAKRMIADLLFWALDKRNCRNDEPANLLIVSNNISDQPELVNVLKALELDGFNILLVQSDEKEEKPDDIPTEGFQWLWRSILEVGGSHVGHQSGSSQFNDICSICGNDVPDFGGDTCSICAKEEEALDQEEQVLQKRNKLLDDIDLKIASLKLYPNYPKVSKTIRIVLSEISKGFYTLDPLLNTSFHYNRLPSPATINPKFPFLFSQVSNPKFPFLFFWINVYYNLISGFIVGGDDDALSKSFRAKRMIADLLFWALDKRNCRNDEPANLLIVSNNISDQPELVNVLKALELDGFNILLVQSDEKEEKPDDIPTEGFQWLWRSILEVGGSHVGHQSGSSQFNDICSICGNDVPDFGGDTCSICAKEEEALDQEEQVLQKRNKLLDDIDLKIASLKLYPNYPKVSKTIRIVLSEISKGFYTLDPLLNTSFHYNRLPSPATINPKFPFLFSQVSNPKFPFLFFWINVYYNLISGFIVGGDDDALSKSFRAKRMIADLLFWALDKRNCRNDEPANLLIVSNNISDQPELVNVLKALELDGFNILLVQSDEKEEKPDDIPTEGFQWLWRSILEVGGSHVGHQSGSSQFNDICSICGNDVPDFGGDTCSICAKEEEALDQEEQVLQKRNKLLDDIDLKIASLKLLFIARKFLKEKKLGVSSWIIDDPRPGQNSRNRRTEPEPNRNTRNRNRTNTLKYSNVGGDDDALSKSFRAKRMIADLLFWALDKRNCRNDEPANLLIVSNNISDQPELVNVLKALELDGFNILLVQSDEKEEKPDDIPTEGFQWLWRSILEVGGSHVGHQSGSSQFNDICSICGNDVPDFGGDTCSICAKEEEALDQEEQVLQKRNKLLDDIDLKIASLKLLFIARKFLKEKKLGVSSWIIDDPRPGQNSRNRRTEPEPNRNTRNRNRTNTLKYSNVGGDDDALSKSFRAKRMIADLLFWALDKRNCRNDEPANLLIVSNNISDQPELVNVLKALELDGFNILLVQSDEKEEKPDDIPTEGFQWLWRSILEVGGSHVGHQSGSSQFNDICSICGNDVPDFGGDTCSICAKEEEALDQEEQVLQKRNKLLDDIDLKIASLKLYPNYPKVSKTIRIVLSEISKGFYTLDPLLNTSFHYNRLPSPATINPKFPFLFSQVSNPKFPFLFFWINVYYNLISGFIVGGDDDALSKSFRAKRMIADLLFWALDKRNCRNDEPANLLIVSNNISDQPELVNVLKALELDGFNILLVQSDEKEEKPDDIPTEGFDWLWRSILEVGGSHVGHQSGSSQFNDICSICGNDVPDFGGDTCSICAKEEEALDQEEQVLQKRNKLLDDIDLKIASLKLYPNYPKVSKTIRIVLSEISKGFYTLDPLLNTSFHYNRLPSPATINPKFPFLFSQVSNPKFPFLFFWINVYYNLISGFIVGGDDDALSKSFRAKRMIADLLFWALDKRNCRNDEPANLLIVSNNISDQPELVNVLKALELDGFNILLVQSDEKEEKPDDIPTEGFDWLWRSILEVGGSHVGHQSGSSQFNDICSICGNDVPDFGGDTCSICAKEEEALDQEEQVLQKRNKLLDDIDLKIASLKLYPNYPKVSKTIRIVLSEISKGFYTLDPLLNTSFHYNRLPSPATINPKFPFLFSQVSNPKFPFLFFWINVYYNLISGFIVGGDDDALSKSFRAKRMIADLLFWALDKRNCRNDEPANLLIVSNNISDQPELVNVLKALELDGFNILLVQSDEKEEKPDDIPTEGFDWLWRSILEVGGSHVGHQSGSSQFNDICSICGNDVPDFGGDTCSICAKEEEALDQEEQVLQKRNKLLDDIDLKIASLKLYPNYPKVSKTIRIVLSEISKGFYTLDPLLNTSFHYNRLPSPATINPKFPFLFSQVSNPKFPFLFFWINVYYNLISGFIVGGDDDALSKSFRAKGMIADLLFWALDKRNCRNDEPANLLIVSNNISDQPELVNVLKALELDGFNILLVQSDEKEEKPDDIPTEGFDWLWRSILEVGGSHVGHQSGSSQFNDICSICGNDVPDFGGDTCSICAKEEEALDQEEQVLQKRNKLLDDIDLKIASLKLYPNYPKVSKTIRIVLSEISKGFYTLDPLLNTSFHYNRLPSPATINPKFPFLFSQVSNPKFPFLFFWINVYYNLISGFIVGGDDDALSKSFRAKRMIADLLFWALDKRNCRNDEPANLLIVSNNISDQPELVNVLKALELDGFNILLVQSDEKEEKPDDIPTEGFDWLWRSILEVGGSHVGHQSGSSQFNDICSICGNDVPDFGGDTCSICAKEEEALDQEEQVLQKRNKLLDDIDLKIASLKLYPNYPKVSKTIRIVLSEISKGFYTLDPLLNTSFHYNRLPSPATINPKFPFLFSQVSNPKFPFLFFWINVYYNLISGFIVGGDDDALSKSFRAKGMIADLLFWALDKRNCRNDEPANLLIVSNNISDQPELVNVLKALELDGFNILLVQSDEKEEKPDDIPTEGFDWLWRSILEVGGSHVGHQSGSSQFNDICSICGNDVPDFGGDTCSICAKEEEALDQEEQVLQKRNKLLDDIDLKIASLKLYPNYPKVSKTIRIVLSEISKGFYTLDPLLNTSFHYNRLPSPATINPKFPFLFSQVSNPKFPFLFFWINVYYNLISGFIVGGDDDALSKSFRAKRMIADLLFWALDKRNCRNDEPANLLIVSNNISDQPELVNVLKALELDGFNILLVQSDEKEEKPDDIPTEGFDWLWRSILEVGGSHVGHQSGSSQFNDICSICGNDVPDFGGDTCSICAKEEEALDQEEQVLQKRNKLLDDIDLKIASLKLLFIARKFLKEKKLGVSSWIIDDPRPGQNSRNRRTEPEPNRNTRNRNRTNTLKYSNGSYIFISEITEPRTERYPNYPKVSKTIRIVLSEISKGFYTLDPLLNTSFHYNRLPSPATINPKFPFLFSQVSNPKFPFLFFWINVYYNLISGFIVGGDDDALSKSFRAKRMIADLLFWALDKRNCRNDEPANLLIVSNNISDQPELVNVLKALELDGFNILLVQSDEKEEKPDDIPTEGFDWLWRSILEVGGSHVGHQSGSSQFNDICSICGNDVPDFGGDTCSICAKEEEALDQEEQVLQKRNKLLDDIDLKIASLKLYPNYPKVSKTIRIVLSEISKGFYTLDPLLNTSFHYNRLPSPATINPKFPFLFSQVSNPKFPFLFFWINVYYNLISGFIVGGDDDALSKSFRAKRMIADLLFWALDKRNCRNDEPANLLIVSNNISDQPELVNVLKALELDGFNILLVQSDEKEEKPDDIPTEGFDWLWRSILEVGGSHVGHQSGSSQFNDICSICGNDVPDFGGDTCSICAKEEEALDQEEQVLQKRNKLLDDIDLKIASLKLYPNYPKVSKTIRIVLSEISKGFYTLDPLLNTSFHYNRLPSPATINPKFPFLFSQVSNPKFPFLFFWINVYYNLISGFIVGGDDDALSKSFRAKRMIADLLFWALDKRNCRNDEPANLLIVSNNISDQPELVNVLKALELDGFNILLVQSDEKEEKPDDIPTEGFDWLWRSILEVGGSHVGHQSGSSQFNDICSICGNDVPDFGGDTCSICAKEEEALDQEEQVLQKRNKLLDDIDLKIASLKLYPNYPKVSKTIRIVLSEISKGFYTLDPLLNTSFHYNRLPSPATINPKFPFLFSQVSNPKFPFLFFWINVYYNLISGFIVGGDDDALSKSFRAKRMIADLLFWALDKRNCRNDEPANLLIVSNNISDQPELVNVLKALELDGFNILLVQSDEKEEKPDDIPTEGFDWLWRSILEVGGSHVGHQSGSSQFNDICSICGNDVPDFGGDTCSICAKEEEALDQEEQVLQKRNKLLDDIDLKIASLKLYPNYPKVSKTIRIVLSEISKGFYTLDPLLNTSFHYNRLPSPATINPKFPFLFSQVSNPKFPFLFFWINVYYNLISGFIVGGDDDALSKSFRAKRMIADLLFWALDKRNCRNDEPANLLIVSNNISDQPELVNVLKALELDGFNILLVQSDEKEEKPDDIPTEDFDWLWRSILEVGGSHVGHQSGSSQFNDICSICGNDVPDFGGDTCSICAKEEEALDQEEQVLQKRNKLLDDIDLKIASLKLLFIARKFLKEKKLGVSSWIIDDPRPGQNSRNRRTEPEPNRNTRNRNRTNTLKYSNVGGDDDALSKSFRAKRMIADLLFWALDKRNCRNDEPANLLIVSNNISDQPELVNVLKALELDGFNILLVQSDEKEEKPDDIPTEGFDWLWRSILEVGGSHVGHQSRSSQFNDICSICGNDVPDFGGDTCSICAKEEEALDQEEQVLQKRNKLLDDIDLKIASLKLQLYSHTYNKIISDLSRAYHLSHERNHISPLSRTFDPRFDLDPIRKSGYPEGPNPDPDSKMLDPSKPDPDPDILIFKSGYLDPADFLINSLIVVYSVSNINSTLISSSSTRTHHHGIKKVFPNYEFSIDE